MPYQITRWSRNWRIGWVLEGKFDKQYMPSTRFAPLVGYFPKLAKDVIDPQKYLSFISCILQQTIMILAGIHHFFSIVCGCNYFFGNSQLHIRIFDCLRKIEWRQRQFLLFPVFVGNNFFNGLLLIYFKGEEIAWAVFVIKKIVY